MTPTTLSPEQLRIAKEAEALMRQLLLPEHPDAMVCLHVFFDRKGSARVEWRYVRSQYDRPNAFGDTLEEMLAARAALPSAVAARIAKLKAELAALEQAP